MKMMLPTKPSRHLSILLLLLGFAGVSTAKACPDEILRLRTSYLPGKMTLCEVYNRYHKALKSLSDQGVATPERISDLHAPRFINLPDWQRYRVGTNYNPALVYPPAPVTWQSWEKGAELMKTYYGKPLQVEAILAIHRRTFEGLRGNAGKLRTHGELGKAISKGSANTEDAIHAMTNLEYKKLSNPKEGLVTWVPTDCFEDRTEEYQKDFTAKFLAGSPFRLNEWPAKKPGVFFADPVGKKRQCGYVLYVDPIEIVPQMDKWIKFVNNASSAIRSPSTYFFDPIWAASRVQRWLIAIHPFDDGNGRVSRYMMEHVLRSLGLPSPVLNDFNNDIYYTERDWAKEIGRGLVEAVRIAETCAKDPTTKGCNPVPL